MRCPTRGRRPCGHRVHRPRSASPIRWPSPCIGQAAFGDEADGSLVRRGRRGRRLGSAGPDVHQPRVLPRAALGRRWRGVGLGDRRPRPRRRAHRGDDAGLGRRHLDRRRRAPRTSARRTRTSSPPSSERIAAYRDENGLDDDALVPVDAVTASASGVDPHISVANARLQAERVADERGLSTDEVLALIDDHTTSRTLGFLGEKGVNVLRAEPRPRCRRAELTGRRWPRSARPRPARPGSRPGPGTGAARVPSRTAGHARPWGARRLPIPPTASAARCDLVTR